MASTKSKGFNPLSILSFIIKYGVYVWTFVKVARYAYEEFSNVDVNQEQTKNVEHEEVS